jgi:hypothetical protein
MRNLAYPAKAMRSNQSWCADQLSQLRDDDGFKSET